MKLTWNNILWILIALALTSAMILFTLEYYEQFKIKRQLEEKGIVVEGTVIEKYIYKDYRNTKYHHIKATFEQEGEPLMIHKLVHRNLYKKLNMDDLVELHYLEKNPEGIDFVENREQINTFYWMLLGTSIFIIATLGVLYLNLIEPLKS